MAITRKTKVAPTEPRAAIARYGEQTVEVGSHNVVPGIDFSNDPLLQGRNFSYLDTQLKRLGGPNYVQLPINAPQCPESFADHYSQARQFYVSQTTLERQHIAAAFVFELSKVETREIRARVVAHLLNIDDKLAMNVAEGLRLDTLPSPATRLVSARDELPASPALSIMRSRRPSFGGRRLGILVTDGVDNGFLRQLETEFNDVGATAELIAPAIGGVKTEDGGWVAAKGTLATAPSVLFDAVALVVSPHASPSIAQNPLALTFVADAFAHCKFIAYTGDARALLDRALAGSALDAGCKQVETSMAAAAFAILCAQLRFWAREPVLGL